MIFAELLEQYELSHISKTCSIFQSELLGTVWTKLIRKGKQGFWIALQSHASGRF